MQRDEIDVMWQQALRDSVKDGEMFTRYHFFKLVADKTRKELREEIIYTWVPPHFVDLAVKEEREACAKLCDQKAEEWANDEEKPDYGYGAAIRARVEPISRGEA